MKLFYYFGIKSISVIFFKFGTAIDQNIKLIVFLSDEFKMQHNGTVYNGKVNRRKPVRFDYDLRRYTFLV